MATILHGSVIVAIMRTFPRATPLKTITMRKLIHGYGAPLGSPSSCRSSAITVNICPENVHANPMEGHNLNSEGFGESQGPKHLNDSSEASRCMLWYKTELGCQGNIIIVKVCI